MDRENRRVIVATLQGGTLYVIDRQEDGSLGKITATFTYEGKEDGKVSTIHQCIWDKAGIISSLQPRGVLMAMANSDL